MDHGPFAHFDRILVFKQMLSKGVVQLFDDALVVVKLRVSTADGCAVALHFFRDGALDSWPGSTLSTFGHLSIL